MLTRKYHHIHFLCGVGLCISVNQIKITYCVDLSAFQKCFLKFGSPVPPLINTWHDSLPVIGRKNASMAESYQLIVVRILLRWNNLKKSID